MSEGWTVSVAGRNYGPYSAAQMQAFAAEGRLAPYSLVQRAGETEFRTASEDPELALLFEPVKPAGTSSGFRDPPASSFGRMDKDEKAAGEKSHFIIIADMKSRSVAGLEEEIFNLGQAYPLLPQVWILASDASINSVRNLLIQKLGKLDILFVVDATHDKAAWFNFGPEAESRIRKIWAKSLDVTARRTASV